MPNPSNIVLQFNMGEGKTSVVAPLVAARAADGTNLVRVVVLRPLARQTFHLLRKTLSGLLDRRIFYLPFSRNLRVDESMATRIQSLFALCTQEKGILLAQPEHILSFRLMGIDLSLGPATSKTAGCLLDSQRWLNQHARDILDESDEILNVAYQLVYTSGSQAALEDHPDRWTVIQQMLASVKKHVTNVHRLCPDEIELNWATEDAFPTTLRILEQAAGHRLLRLVAQETMQSVPRSHLFSHELYRAAIQFVSGPVVDPSSLDLLKSHCKPTALWSGLLLRRGMLAGGILSFVLGKKRYRVDYGLDLTRTMLAVPYRAKDVPSPRADFGHPDVVLALTCLW